MKGITLVQAFQYWLKMFAISVPVFVLMAVYGHYGKQVGANTEHRTSNPERRTPPGTNELRSDVESSMLEVQRSPLPPKAPADLTWLSPFGPLTTKAAKAAKPDVKHDGKLEREDVDFGGTPWPARIKRVFNVDDPVFAIAIGGTRTAWDLVKTYADYKLLTERINLHDRISYLRSEKLKEIRLRCAIPKNVPSVIVPQMEKILADGGVTVVREAGNVFKAFPTKDAVITPVDPKPLALLYTYSLIIALVCGTAGLPHILVRFYTNPDGVAAKRTTMWVMILIGVFYLFPPIFGVMGRNLLPELYAGTGAKGTDKVVLELPRILNSHSPADSLTRSEGGEVSGRVGERVRVSGTRIPWGSILSGITCAGAFAAFMSTFSGLLVSMTGALAHDVYGRMLRPKSTPEQRLRAFKIAAVLIGTAAILLGTQVEPLQINFMVGQAFAIAAASYFPLLFMSAWWRGMTMKGAAAGMLTGGLLAVAAISLTSFSDLKWLALDDFWAAHPLLRILCEQPAIWTVPLAIALMIVVSKLTKKEIPADIRMKMLVLHAPEKLGLKQEYIQEHQAH